jgi:pimeloyl-ACP methyl ester carboxylesterase
MFRKYMSATVLVTGFLRPVEKSHGARSMLMKKRYIDGVFGQVHMLETESPIIAKTPPLFCLHATAYSSQTFKPLLSAFEGGLPAPGRKLYALDTPGYGGSDRPPAPIDMGGYADALIDAITRLSEGPVDVLGYHTGVYIAAEAAIRRPDLFRKLVLIGVPFFHGPDRDMWRARLSARHSLGETLDQFDERWTFFITNRSARLPLSRAFENFVDELRAWPDGSWSHEALFAYDDIARLPLVATRTLIINPPGHLAEGSRAAARLMPNAEIVEAHELEAPVFETAPRPLRGMIEGFLDGR